MHYVALPLPNLAVLAAGGLACGYAVVQFGWALLARRWPAVEGEIIDVRFVHTRTSQRGHENFRSLVSYRYHVAGQPYTNHRVRFGQLTPNSWIPARNNPAVSATDPAYRLRRGKPVRVYYNPRRPDDSVLYLMPDFRVWVLLLAGLYLAYAAIHGGMWPLNALTMRPRHALWGPR